MDTSRLADMLRAILSSDDPKAAISALQDAVWNAEKLPQGIEGLVRDLAYDLDFYEPEPAVRSEDRSYFGTERLIEEVSDALRAVEDARRDSRL